MRPKPRVIATRLREISLAFAAEEFNPFVFSICTENGSRPEITLRLSGRGYTIETCGVRVRIENNFSPIGRPGE